MRYHLYLLFSVYFLGIHHSYCQNNSLHFDGIDDYITLGNHLDYDYTDSFTIETWIKTNYTSNYFQIVSKVDLDLNGWGFHIDHGILAGYVYPDYQGGIYLYIKGTTVVNDGNWHHVAMIHHGDETISLFVDGVQETTSKIGNGELFSISGNASILMVGNDYNDDFEDEYFEGSMDDLRIWNKALTPEEIQANYLSEIDCSANDLALYFKYDEHTTECDVIDSSINAHHGTRIGTSGDNNLPQYQTDIPKINNVGCDNQNCTTLHITQQVNKTTTFVYPTIAQQYLYFKHLNRKEQFTIINKLGITVQLGSISPNDKISIENLASGSYYIKIDNMIFRFFKN